MKNLILVGFGLLLSVSAVAQVEVSDNDTTATSQITRAATKYYSGIAYRVQKGKTPRRIGFYDEIVAASAGGVQQVNGIAPTGGNVNITYGNLLSKPTNLSGFGITDGVSTAGSYVNPSWLASIPFSKLTSTPTTRAGYGITDAEPTVTPGVSGQYYTGTKTWASLDKTAVGLGNVDNTTDLNKPVSGPQQTALNQKADVLATLPYSGVSAYTSLNSIAAPATGYLKLVMVSTDGQYTESNSIYIIKPSGKIHKISLLPAEN